MFRFLRICVTSGDPAMRVPGHKALFFLSPKKSTHGTSGRNDRTTLDDDVNILNSDDLTGVGEIGLAMHISRSIHPRNDYFSAGMFNEDSAGS